MPLRSSRSRDGGTRPVNLMERADGKKDDLKKIKGVGEQLERRLNNQGVFHYIQVSKWTPEEVKFMDEKLKSNGRIAREDWVGQAKLLLKPT